MIGNNEFSTSPLSPPIFAKKNVLAAAIMLFNDEILDEDDVLRVFRAEQEKSTLSVLELRSYREANGRHVICRNQIRV